MPRYDYRCSTDGVFELEQRMKDHAKGICPTCGSECKQVVLSAPQPMIEQMADAGCPGAFATSGDRMTKRHRMADQDWTHD
jgi:putative FmdB family regulatory protein